MLTHREFRRVDLETVYPQIKAIYCGDSLSMLPTLWIGIAKDAHGRIDITVGA